MSDGGFLYQKVYDDVSQKVRNGIYKQGDKLPSDSELSSIYKVSIITVKRALNLLRDEGIVQRVSGVGTFIRRSISEDGTPQEAEPVQNLKIIGLVIEHVSSSFGLDLLYAMDMEASRRGYKLITRFSFYDRDKETEEVNFLMGLRPAGLVVMPCHGMYYNPCILKLILDGFPVVVVDKKLDGISVPSVRTDNVKAVRELVREAYEAGCRKIGFATPRVEGTSSLLNRKNGFYEEIRNLGIEPQPECGLNFESDIFEHVPFEENIDKAQSYIEDSEADAIICAEYSIVPAIEEAMRRLGRKDLYISCVDGPMMLPHTHMRQDERKIAAKCIETLINEMEGVKNDADIIVDAVINKVY